MVDMYLHDCYDLENGESPSEVLLRMAREILVLPPLEEDRSLCCFYHIFANGYAAGYYSYKWAEVLSADAFSRFEEDGIFNPETGTAFRTHILATGGSKEPMELFVAFRGREPDIEPLLRHSGIAAATPGQ